MQWLPSTSRGTGQACFGSWQELWTSGLPGGSRVCRAGVCLSQLEEETCPHGTSPNSRKPACAILGVEREFWTDNANHRLHFSRLSTGRVRSFKELPELRIRWWQGELFVKTPSPAALHQCSVHCWLTQQIQSDGVPLLVGKQDFVLAASAYIPGPMTVQGHNGSRMEWEHLTSRAQHEAVFPFPRELLKKQTLLWMTQMRKWEMRTGEEDVLFKWKCFITFHFLSVHLEFKEVLFWLIEWKITTQHVFPNKLVTAAGFPQAWGPYRGSLVPSRVAPWLRQPPRCRERLLTVNYLFTCRFSGGER